MGVWLWSSMVRGGSGCCMESRNGVVRAGLRGQLVCLAENCQKFVKWGRGGEVGYRFMDGQLTR